MRRHILGLLVLTLDLSLLLGYKSHHRRPLVQTLRNFMTAYFQHYRAGYLVGLQTVVCHCVLVAVQRRLQRNILCILPCSL